MLYLRDGAQYTVETQLAERTTVMAAARSVWIHVYVGIQKKKNNFIAIESYSYHYLLCHWYDMTSSCWPPKIIFQYICQKFHYSIRVVINI